MFRDVSTLSCLYYFGEWLRQWYLFLMACFIFAIYGSLSAIHFTAVRVVVQFMQLRQELLYNSYPSPWMGAPLGGRF